jgi:hypothetical protein
MEAQDDSQVSMDSPICMTHVTQPFDLQNTLMYSPFVQ